MAQISTLWVPPCSRAGPSARSRARAKFQGKEGRAGRGRRAQLGGKIQQLLVVGYVPLRSREVLLQAGVLCRGCAAQPAVEYPACRATSVPPSWGRAKGQCEVVRGKRRQQLDELEFLSGRGGWWGQVLAGPGKGSRPSVMAGRR